MSLSPGARLGPYEILSPLGAGGMGEVYRARDTRLGREVAIKVLPSELSSDASRLGRFEKEARSASSLNHPNIVTIYDIGKADSVSYIAMELVKGSTVRDLLADGALPVRRLLQIAAQVADGLARAHASGIVHRDLKPENVMVTEDGVAKILDFGLAKLMQPEEEQSVPTQAPTISVGTDAGVVIGTVGYMSPEQARGKAVDFRSDQFALGSVLYEMATGRRAFTGESKAEVQAAIIREEPEPIPAVNPKVPAPLRWIVDRCLAKDPRERYSSTDDLARDLATLRDHFAEAMPSGPFSTAARSDAARRRLVLPVLGAIVAAVALLAIGVLSGPWLTSRRARMEKTPSFRRLTFRRGNVLHARFAPDGRTVVYGAAWEGTPSEIFTVRTDSIESRSVGLSRADVLAVSSKGELAVLLKKILFFRKGGEGTLARISLGGGTPREILEDVYDADWAPNGEDLAVVRRLPSGKVQLEYPIGSSLGEVAGYSTLRVSPKGDLVAFVDRDVNGLLIATIDRNRKRRVISRGWNRFYGEIVWAPRGDELIFAASRSGRDWRDWAIHAVSLWGHERILVAPAPGFVIHDAAPDGRLLLERATERDGIACQSRGESRERELGWLDGSIIRDISHDGKLVLFVEQGEAADTGTFLRRTDGTPPIRLGDGDGQSLSAEGRWALCLLTGPPVELVMLPTGPGTAKKIPVEGVVPLRAWILPNGKGFFVVTKGLGGWPTLSLLGSEGGKPRLVGADPHARGLAVSPNGDRFAYVASDNQLKIVPLSGGEATTVPGAPLEQNEFPVQWSADGRFLYILRSQEIPARVDHLELATGRREPWKRLIPQDSAGILGIGPVCIAPDGQSYAYSYIRELASDLYVVEGLK